MTMYIVEVDMSMYADPAETFSKSDYTVCFGISAENSSQAIEYACLDLKTRGYDQARVTGVLRDGKRFITADLWNICQPWVADEDYVAPRQELSEDEIAACLGQSKVVEPVVQLTDKDIAFLHGMCILWV